MENYIKTRNTIVTVCNQSGLSLVELCGILNECLADIRDSMMIEVLQENMTLKAQMIKAAEEKQAEDQKAEKKEEK